MKKKKGFTLVELMCVLVILGLLALLVARLMVKNVETAKKEITETQQKSILNAAEKWAVNNSDAFDDQEAKVGAVNLNIVFVVDVSTSMTEYVKGSKTERYKAAADALNGAIDVFKASSTGNVSIGFVFYASKVTDFIPLQTVYPDTDMHFNAFDDAWDEHNCLRHSEKGESADCYKPEYFEINGKTINMESGTFAQGGMAKGVDLLLDAKKASTIPVLIFLTDGESYYYSTAYDASTYQDVKDNRHSSSTIAGKPNVDEKVDGRVEAVWYTIQQAMNEKYLLQQEFHQPPFFYTIGLGITTKYAAFMLDPSEERLQAVKDSTHYIDTALSQYFIKEGEYSYYPTAAYVNDFSADELKTVFSSIASEVVQGAKVTQTCVSIDQLYQDGYLNRKDIDLASGKAAGTYVMMSYNATTNQWDYNLLEEGTPLYDENIEYCKSLYE